MVIGNLELTTVNYSGHRFAGFYAQRDHSGPGWYVFGRNAEKYGTLPSGDGAYVMLCARPNVKARRHPHFIGQVRRGWATKREATAVAAALNAKLA